MESGLARLAVATGCLLMAAAAAARTYPTRQIRLVVPFVAGGPVDLLARVIAEERRISASRSSLITDLAETLLGFDD
jgi:tripartite-type tricarboxylate transporter receptor subunit TctC